ncbi:DUF5704 domain-containing protein [Paenibacillus sp. ACRSA]|uniref:DUF5704 domain-containing protein n=1 Tax=Paenibacillus sp. ACRSA TaxID=2918211 RepID=UPI001EF670E5|nr:DUF5704 domain-containing protein [Paenibacillus sp. ACRSA]MCG7380510.1 DUF5704 domain-containing protein [Paenibacillus sp. ACRSA]
MKKIVAFVMVSYLLLTITNYFGYNLTVSAAVPNNYEFIGDVRLYSDIGKVDAENNHYIPSSQLAYTTVVVPKKGNSIATSVAIYDNNGKMVKNLTKVSDTSWNIGNIQGDKITLSAKANGQYQGYFAWFRAPSGRYWMYDYKGQRYFLKSNNASFPPSSGEWTFGTVGNIPTSGWKQGSNTNMVWSERTITVGSTFQENFSSPTLPGMEFEMSELAKVIVKKEDLTYWKCPEICMQAAKIHDVRDIAIDDSNKRNVILNFEFLATFDNFAPGGEVVSDNENGLVRRWYNGWNVMFHGEIYKYPEMKIYAKYDGPDKPEDPGGGGACTPNIGPPSQGTTMNRSDLDPNARGVIKADNRDAERFDVLKGIPTSESLYTNAIADNYLFDQSWARMTGKTTYDCNVTLTYAREWTIPGPEVCPPKGACSPGPPVKTGDTVTKPYSFQITRDYSYWKINKLEVYNIAKATMENYALPGTMVTMMPSGYTPPTLESQNDEAVESHVKPAPTAAISYTPPKRTGGLNSPPDVPDDTSLLKGMAESNTPQSKVNNDLVIFNNNKVMDDAEATKDGPTPTNIPDPTPIGRDVLYMPNNMISSTLLNKANTTSSGEIFYNLLPGNVNGGANKVLPIPGINTVTVHTPVVNYSWVSDDQPHNQKTVPDPSSSALILERPFIVRIPTSGQHLEVASYPGYGNRDYAKYFRIKQVQFPFDVYNADRSQFIPAETWVDIPVNQLDTGFYLPVWVDEGHYQVKFRNIAENAPSTFTTQPDANTNLAHHVATDTVPVEVIGRLYDFHVTDISDYNWENVFRKQMGSSAASGVSYWTGTNGIDGDPRGNLAPFVLPIHPGSHPVQGFRNIAVKTGYHVKFDLKTKGNMFGTTDGVRITPTFDFVSKDGTSRQAVDLYYHRGQERLIQIGSPQDLEKRFVVLNSRLRNVPGTELGDTARYRYTYELTAQERNQTTLAEYMVQLVDQISHQKTWVGRYDWMILPASIRTLIGPKANIPATVNVDRANAAIQRWYGEYSLPADVYAVPKGTDLVPLARQNALDEKSDVFLKNGYIVVNFNLETLRNGKTDAPHLQYIHAPLMNQWRLEGFIPNQVDDRGRSLPVKDGDVVFYHADQSSRNDFQAQVPH